MPDKRPNFLKPTGPKKRKILVSDESDGMGSDYSEESDDVCEYSPRNGDGKLLSNAFTETARFFMVPAADTILKIFHLKTPNQGIVIRMQTNSNAEFDLIDKMGNLHLHLRKSPCQKHWNRFATVTSGFYQVEIGNV